MRKRMIMTVLLMAVCKIVSADLLTIYNFDISAGETKEVSIYLQNDETYVAFQFDLYLPEGVTVAKSPKGKIQSYNTAVYSPPLVYGLF